MADYCTVAEVNEVLGQSAAVDSTLIGSIITQVSGLFDRLTGETFASTSRTQTVSGLNGIAVIVLEFRPISITSVVEDSTTLDSGLYELDGYRLWRVNSNGTTINWANGTRNIVVTYASGFSTTPPAIHRACIEETVRGYMAANTQTGEGNRIGLTGKSPEFGGSYSYTEDDLSPITLRAVNAYRRMF